MIRTNPDDRMRRLEREALTGDLDAAWAWERELLRADPGRIRAQSQRAVAEWDTWLNDLWGAEHEHDAPRLAHETNEITLSAENEGRVYPLRQAADRLVLHYLITGSPQARHAAEHAYAKWISAAEVERRRAPGHLRVSRESVEMAARRSFLHGQSMAASGEYDYLLESPLPRGVSQNPSDETSDMTKSELVAWLEWHDRRGRVQDYTGYATRGRYEAWDVERLRDEVRRRVTLDRGDVPHDWQSWNPPVDDRMQRLERAALAGDRLAHEDLIWARAYAEGRKPKPIQLMSHVYPLGPHHYELVIEPESPQDKKTIASQVAHMLGVSWDGSSRFSTLAFPAFEVSGGKVKEFAPIPAAAQILERLRFGKRFSGMGWSEALYEAYYYEVLQYWLQTPLEMIEAPRRRRGASVLKNSDSRLRQLERDCKSGDKQACQALLHERVRSGQVSHDELLWAAAFGSTIAEDEIKALKLKPAKISTRKMYKQLYETSTREGWSLFESGERGLEVEVINDPNAWFWGLDPEDQPEEIRGFSLAQDTRAADTAIDRFVASHWTLEDDEAAAFHVTQQAVTGSQWHLLALLAIRRENLPGYGDMAHELLTGDYLGASGRAAVTTEDGDFEVPREILSQAMSSAQELDRMIVSYMVGAEFAPWTKEPRKKRGT